MAFCLCLFGFAFAASLAQLESKSAHQNPPPFGQCIPLSLSLYLSLCLPAQLLLSAWRIRMLSNCYSFVAMRIHSFDSHSHAPSLKPPLPRMSLPLPYPWTYPFSSWQFLRLRQFCRLCRAILRLSSSSSSSPVWLCVFSVLSCSIYPSVLRTDVLFKRTLLLFHFDETNLRTPCACAHHTKRSKWFSSMKVACKRI